MGSNTDEVSGGGGSRVRGLVLKALVLIGGALLLKRLTKATTRWDHARIVAEALSGEKFSRDQASRDPDNFFNLRMLTCPVTEMVDGSRVLYHEQAFWRTPQKPFRQVKLLFDEQNVMVSSCGCVITTKHYNRFFDLGAGYGFETTYAAFSIDMTLKYGEAYPGARFYMVKPCPKEMKCDVELSTYAIRDAEEYKNFCDRSKDQRPQEEEVIADVAEHLTTIHLSRCERGKRCLYEGSTPPGGFPNSWNGASYCTSEMVVHKNGEVHTWDRGYDEEGNQIWGVKEGPYEFKPAPTPAASSSFSDILSPLNLPPAVSLEKRIEGSFVMAE